MHVSDLWDFSYHITVLIGFDVSEIADMTNLRVEGPMSLIKRVVVEACRVASLSNVSLCVNMQSML